MAIITRTTLRPAETATWPPQGKWTYEDYTRLPRDGWQYEVIYGRLTMVPAPMPIHQQVVIRLGAALLDFLRHHPLGEVFPAPTDVLVPGKAEPVQPDLLFVATERLNIVTKRAIEGAPDLVVEVLSPSTWLDDRRTKYVLYADLGVREYWMVDPDERTVEVFVLQEGRYGLVNRYGPDETLRSDLLPGFGALVRELFPA
jgi:Uma2 family endonuclease